MNLIVAISCVLFSVVAGVEHATDIQIDQVEVIEIPWQEAPPQQSGNSPPSNVPPPVYGPPPPDCQQPPQEPKPVYGPPPKPVYGPPPEVTTTEAPTTTEAATTTESSTDSSTTTEQVTTTEQITTTGSPGNDTGIKSENLKLADDVDQGVYYVYHPKGLLQKVSYSTKNDENNMEYSARLRYQNVEPIKGPIYTYDPETFAFQRLNK